MPDPNNIGDDRIRTGRDHGDHHTGTEPPASTRQLRFLPRGMSRIEAAAYVGVSPSLFDEMVKDGRMPGPKRINTRVVWDRFALDAAFEALPDKVEAVPDDDWQVAV
jgi:predicted DNA-binding transcriptional regulator AlpA